MGIDTQGHRRPSQRGGKRKPDGRVRRRLALVTDQWLAELRGQVVPLRTTTPKAPRHQPDHERDGSDWGPSPSSAA
jgi:hypothetical protein